jgi:hypothetical protein
MNLCVRTPRSPVRVSNRPAPARLLSPAPVLSLLPPCVLSLIRRPHPGLPPPASPLPPFLSTHNINITNAKHLRSL